MITPQEVRAALWTALRSLEDDCELTPAEIPVFDEQDGPGGWIDGPIPERLYERLADLLNDVG